MSQPDWGRDFILFTHKNLLKYSYFCKKIPIPFYFKTHFKITGTVHI